MESCECSYMSQENPVYPVNPVLSLYASGDAPASEVSNRRSGKGGISTRECSPLYTSPSESKYSVGYGVIPSLLEKEASRKARKGAKAQRRAIFFAPLRETCSFLSLQKGPHDGIHFPSPSHHALITHSYAP